MSPPKQVTKVLVLFFAIAIPRVVVGQHQPYYFDYQQQQQPEYQQNPYQPYTNAPPGFTNAPPGTYYTPTYESHTSGGGGHHAGGHELLGNFFNNRFSPAPTSPASNPLVTYPTQVTTLDGSRHHLSHQPYQPIGNSLVQQTPTAPTTTTTNAFRPSPLINHHSHIVNGLPQRQFFGNNYEFFRDRHGLPTFTPFTHPNSLQSGASASPSPTPALVSTTAASASPSASPSKASESKPISAVKGLPLDIPSSPSPPPTTQSTFLSRFPFNGPSTFSPATNQQQNYRQVAKATTPAPRTFPTAQPTTAASPAGVSPSFQFSQYFPETDSINSNELSRQPLFQSDGDDEEEEDDDDNYTLNNNGNSNYYSTQARQVPQQRPQQQVLASPSSTSSPTQSYKSGQQTSYNSGGSLNNGLNYQTKNEPAPIRVHNTTPIRIVFNYEQAAQALEENPGVRVIIAQTEKNNLTQDEFSTTVWPYYSPAPSPASVSATSPRSATSPAIYQATSTARPSNYGTYRPAVFSTNAPPPVSSTPPPQRASPTPRFQYQTVNVPYNTQTAQDEGTTAAALENLALELEGRFAGTGRPSLVSQQPIYETVATLATEPTPTEDPLRSYKRGGKKYVAIPSGGDKVYKVQEPRVVVNDLANIYVQNIQPGRYYSSTPSSTFPRQSLRDFDQVEEVSQEVDDLSDEIAHLSQQLQQQEFRTTTTSRTTTTTTPRPPPRSSPQPRLRPTVTPRLLRITTYRPPFTFPSTFKSTTTPPPPTLSQAVEETEETLPEVNNQLSSEPPELTPRRQPQRYYYNNRQRDGISGAHQRYEYNGVDNPSSSASPQTVEEQSQPQQKPQKVLRRRPRPRGRLVAGSPPRSVQVNGGPGGALGPVVGPDGFPAPFLAPGIAFQAGPGGQLGPVPPGVHLPVPVFRVGPRGRLLRRKTRPRAQLQGQQPSLAPSEAPSVSPSLAPSPSSPSAFQEIASPNLVSAGPSQLPPLSPYSPNPFIPQEVPLVTTFRPGPPPNILLQQSLVDQEEERKQERPNTFRSRFRYQPSSTTSTSEDDDEGASNQYESEEETPVTQRRRFSTTSTTTEKPVEKAVISDRANILQRQIRFNRNRKNQKNNKES